MDHFPNDTIDKGVFVSAQVLIIAVVFLLCTEGIDTTWVPLIFLILQTCAKMCRNCLLFARTLLNGRLPRIIGSVNFLLAMPTFPTASSSLDFVD